MKPELRLAAISSITTALVAFGSMRQSEPSHVDNPVNETPFTLSIDKFPQDMHPLEVVLYPEEAQRVGVTQNLDQALTSEYVDPRFEREYQLEIERKLEEERTRIEEEKRIEEARLVEEARLAELARLEEIKKQEQTRLLAQKSSTPNAKVLPVNTPTPIIPDQQPVGVNQTDANVWDVLADCETGDGHVGSPYSAQWNYNGASGYDGGLQFHPQTWNSLNTGYDYAWQAPREVQIQAAINLQIRAGWGQWPSCTSRMKAAGFIE